MIMTVIARNSVYLLFISQLKKEAVCFLAFIWVIGFLEQPLFSSLAALISLPVCSPPVQHHIIDYTWLAGKSKKSKNVAANKVLHQRAQWALLQKRLAIE